MDLSLEIPDALYPSDNDFEIPTLRADMQCKQCEIPFLAFGEQKRTYDMNYSGTLHFYVDDYRFSVIYEHPSKILQHHPANIVEPNFSLFNEMPVSFALQAIYKKRWISRSMQDRGIRVLEVRKLQDLILAPASDDNPVKDMEHVLNEAAGGKNDDQQEPENAQADASENASKRASDEEKAQPADPAPAPKKNSRKRRKVSL